MLADTDRLDRAARFAAKQRRDNREAGVPDMELAGEHLPCEWFAQLGFFAVLERIGQSQPVEDWSQEGGTDADREAYLAARTRDHQRVADWLREADVYPIGNRDGATFGVIRIGWPDRVPALKVWAGQMTLAKIAKKLQAALPREVADVLAVTAGLKGASGLDRQAAPTALEAGFSLNATGMLIETRIGMELLAIIGAETIPLTVYPDGRIGYEAGETRWAFAIEDRNDYYGRWGTARRYG